jgi:general secretion pathway protein A
MAYLEYGLHQNEGFIVITGEIGAGKTTLVRDLFGKLDTKEVVAANLVSTQLDADDILRMVAAAFGLPTKQITKSDLLLSLEAYLVSIAAKGKRCLLVVDEAQNLTPRAVEELRMLSNFQLETHALLQSFLVGQPEFRRILQSAELQQLRQRVIASCHIGPMDASDTRGYIEHRLKHVGWKDTPELKPDAYDALFEASGGVPRRINSVCDRLLLSGFLAEKRVFGREDVEEIAEDMRDEGLAPNSTGSSEAVRPDAATSSMLDTEGQQLAETLGGGSLQARLIQMEESMSRLERCLLRLIRCVDRLQARLQITLPES